MEPSRRRPLPMHAISGIATYVLAIAAGCASPGPPKPPSLGLPQAVRTLTAEREGDAVTLRFQVPSRTTDQQPIRSATLVGELCREVGREMGAGAPCIPVDEGETQKALPVPGAGAGSAPEVVWVDRLPPDLATGATRVLAYRVAFRSANGRAGEASDLAYAVAGDVPPPVAGFRAQAMRRGVLLRWTAEKNAGEVLIERTSTEGSAAVALGTQLPTADSDRHKPSRKAKNADTVWLQAQPGNTGAAETIDGSAEEGTPYLYRAFRRRLITVGARTLEVRSAPSLAVGCTWLDVYPPPTPSGLTALGFDTAFAPPGKGLPAGYAVDLIWQPVDDPRLAGYLVYRQALDGSSQPLGQRTRLTPEPVTTPGFHDATALPAVRYKYGVTSIDAKSNESNAAEATVQPVTAP